MSSAHGALALELQNRVGNNLRQGAHEKES